MNNQPPQPPKKPVVIHGEPIDLDVLLAFAEVDELDMEHAAEWWDTHASIDWVGALDSEPIDDGQ